MTDKIRIVGEFGSEVISQVDDFVKGLEGVAHVEVLRNGVEIFSTGEKNAGVPVTETPDGEAETPPAAAKSAPKRSRARASK